MIRILIADDHLVVRRGLVQILLEEFHAARIGQASDADGLLAQLLKEEWELVITDISMPGRSALEAVQQMRQHYPKLPILVLSMYPEDQYAIRVMQSGASGTPVADIAAMLFLSPTTVSTYRSRVMTKMSVKSNADLTRYALENKLL